MGQELCHNNTNMNQSFNDYSFLSKSFSAKNEKLLLESVKFGTIETKGTNKELGQYQIGNKIGMGSYGVVYHAIHPYRNQQFAVKCINKQKITLSGNDKTMQHLLTEIEVMSTIQSQNIIRLYDIFQDQTNYYLVLDYCDSGDFVAYLKKIGKSYLEEKEAIYFLKQLKEAFVVLRRNQVMHRDIKLENLFVNGSTLKLGDFGFSKKGDDTAHSILGSKFNMAPEILLSIGGTARYNYKCDLWSIGCVFYQMLFGTKFNQSSCGQGSLQSQINSVKNYKRENLSFPRQVSEHTKHMLRGLLTKDSSKRMSFEEFFQHPIFGGDTGRDIQFTSTNIANRNQKVIQSKQHRIYGNQQRQYYN